MPPHTSRPSTDAEIPLLHQPVSTIGGRVMEFFRDLFQSKVTRALAEDPVSSPAPPPKPFGTFEIPPEDAEEYIPRDAEFGESLGETPRMFEIRPALTGYYASGRKSYFDTATLLWSKRKQLSSPAHTPSGHAKSYTYSGVLRSGLIAIPLPYGYVPSTDSLTASSGNKPQWQRDQKGIWYLQSRESGVFSCAIHSDLNIPPDPPTPADSQKLLNGRLSRPTTELLVSLKGKSAPEIALQLQTYIHQTKKYPLKIEQGSLREMSIGKDYFVTLDTSPLLECYSANSLFIALARELGVASRLVVGHHIGGPDKSGAAAIGSQNGHAWSEVWDATHNKWVIYDATPQQKENGAPSEQGGSSNGGRDTTDNNGAEGSEAGKKTGESSKSGGDGTSGGGSGGTGGERVAEGSSLDPKQALEEMKRRLEEDHYRDGEEILQKTKKAIEQSTNSREVAQLTEEAKKGLKQAAQKLLEELSQDRRLEIEKASVENLSDESAIDQALQESKLDTQRKQVLTEYIRRLKERIREERERKKVAMTQLGFEEAELELYREYCTLEDEVRGEIKRQIQLLQRVLPLEYRSEDEGHFRSGRRIDRGKLTDWATTGDDRVFLRRHDIVDTQRIAMYETIIIDRSGSMGKLSHPGSPMREAVKAAIIRARTLEHFHVQFSLMFFDEITEEVMSFGDKWSDKRAKIPARLMRGAAHSGGTNISAGLIHGRTAMDIQRKNTSKGVFGNITFLGDGEPMSGLTGAELVKLIQDIRDAKYGLTAFYIDTEKTGGRSLTQYFGDQESGGTVIVDDVTQLPERVLDHFNKGLKRIISKQRY